MAAIIQIKDGLMDESQQLAKLWTTLEHVKEQIDNIAVPLGCHLGLDDPELMVALEELSHQITTHFERLRLVTVVSRLGQG
jgi:hypothetical protein